MTSAINANYPVEGTPTTESVRENFQAAADEITALQGALAPFSGLSLPIPIADGGTGATNAPAALAALGGVSSPASIAHGGTGSTTAPAALTALGAVAKSGDTMTGALNLTGAGGGLWIADRSAPTHTWAFYSTAGLFYLQNAFSGAEPFICNEAGEVQYTQRIAIGSNGMVGPTGSINAAAYYLAGNPHLVRRSDVAELVAADPDRRLPLSDWTLDPAEGETAIGLLVAKPEGLSLEPVLIGEPDSAGPGFRTLRIRN